MDIQLNCDMGEGYSFDEDIFPYIHMANLACGYHAGDDKTMQKSILLALKHDVAIGAHISYKDIENFGRKSIKYSDKELEAICRSQINTLHTFCKNSSTKFSYIKPHGAMYNDMMKDDNIFQVIVKAISAHNQDIKMMILSTQNNQKYQKIASPYGIELIYEVFADRNYTREGFLVPRSDEDAVIYDIDLVINRIKNLKENGYLEAIDGTKLNIQADTICVHGDNEKALDFVKQLNTLL